MTRLSPGPCFYNALGGSQLKGAILEVNRKGRDESIQMTMATSKISTSKKVKLDLSTCFHLDTET